MITKRKNSLFIIEKLKEVIFSKEIILKYRNNETDFTRKRKQPFGQMLLFMFNLVKKSLVIEIDNFVEFLNSKTESKDLKDFTKSAFVQKRLKINPEVFNHLSEVIVENTYVAGNSSIKFFKGFRLLAVDGSKITLPYSEDLKIVFGESKNNTPLRKELNNSLLAAQMSLTLRPLLSVKMVINNSCIRNNLK